MNSSASSSASKRRFTPKELLTIFLTTFKIGLVTFGGGLAMIPIIQREYSEKHDWVSAEDISDIVVLAQSLPGPVAVNTSILTGCRMGGAGIGVLTGVSCVLPSFIVICIVTLCYNAFITNPYVLGALRGISGTVIALFVTALVKMGRQNIKDWYGVAIAVAVIALIFLFPAINIIWYIIGGGVVGFLLYYVLLRRRGGGGNA